MSGIKIIRTASRALTVLTIALSFNLYAQSKAPFKVDVLADGLERPWAVSQKSDGQLVITERNGNLRIYNKQGLSKPIAVPDKIYNAGQGGMLDVTERNIDGVDWLYMSYASGDNDNNQLVVSRAQLVNSQLENFQVIFKASPIKKGGYHFAGRITFLPDNSLIFGVGDGYSYMKQAQTLDNHFGKLVRINHDGSVPEDNPFYTQAKQSPKQYLATTYSYGHRNPQGMFYDEKRNIVFSHEHGPKGGDEINIILPGKNYGWPEITYGVDYSGEIISDLTHKEGMEQPILQWTPSIAPSSMLVYDGEMFPQFKGHLLVTTLKYRELRLVEILDSDNGVKMGEQTIYMKDVGERLRDIEQGQRGELYIVTDAGQLLKLSK